MTTVAKGKILSLFEIAHEMNDEDLLTFAKKQHPMIEKLIDNVSIMCPKIMAAVEKRKLSVSKSYFSVIQSVAEQSHLITTRVTAALGGSFQRDHATLVTIPTSIRQSKLARDLGLEQWCLKAELLISSKFPLLNGNTLIGAGNNHNNDNQPSHDESRQHGHVVVVPTSAVSTVMPSNDKVCIRAKLVEVVNANGDCSYRYECDQVVPHPSSADARAPGDRLSSLVQWLMTSTPHSCEVTPTAVTLATLPAPAVVGTAAVAAHTTTLPFDTWNARRMHYNAVKKWVCRKTAVMFVWPVVCIFMILLSQNGLNFVALVVNPMMVSPLVMFAPRYSPTNNHTWGMLPPSMAAGMPAGRWTRRMLPLAIAPPTPPIATDAALPKGKQHVIRVNNAFQSTAATGGAGGHF